MVIIGLHVRYDLVVACVNVGRVVVGHRLVVVILLRRNRRRRAQGHRCGSEALHGHRQQRHPDNQHFQQVFHRAILAHAKVHEIRPYRLVTVLAVAVLGRATSAFNILRRRIVRICDFCMC